MLSGVVSESDESDGEHAFVFPSSDKELKTELKMLWGSLNPPTKEEDVVGKLYAIDFIAKKRHVLYIG